MKGEVIVTIGPKGEVKMDAEGFVGTGCKDLMKRTIDALGGEVLEERKKGSYYETEQQGIQIGGM